MHHLPAELNHPSMYPLTKKAELELRKEKGKNDKKFHVTP